MRGSAVALGLAFVVLGAGGCGDGGGDAAGGTTSSRTADSWVSAMNDGDFGAACDVMAPAALRSLDDGTSCTDAVRRLHQRYPKLQRASALLTLASADQANHVITLDVSDERGGPRLHLVRTGDRWRITRIDR